jgi:hypothetical protein
LIYYDDDDIKLLNKSIIKISKYIEAVYMAGVDEPESNDFTLTKISM